MLIASGKFLETVCCLQSECAAGKYVERLEPGQAGDRADNDAPEWLRSSLGFQFSMVVLAYLKKKAEIGSGKYKIIQAQDSYFAHHDWGDFFRGRK